MIDDVAERRRVMAEGNELRARVRELRDADRTDGIPDPRTRIWAINDRYRELLPEIPIARRRRITVLSHGELEYVKRVD